MKKYLLGALGIMIFTLCQCAFAGEVGVHLNVINNTGEDLNSIGACIDPIQDQKCEFSVFPVKSGETKQINYFGLKPNIAASMTTFGLSLAGSFNQYFCKEYLNWGTQNTFFPRVTSVHEQLMLVTVPIQDLKEYNKGEIYTCSGEKVLHENWNGDSVDINVTVTKVKQLPIASLTSGTYVESDDSIYSPDDQEYNVICLDGRQTIFYPISAKFPHDASFDKNESAVEWTNGDQTFLIGDHYMFQFQKHSRELLGIPYCSQNPAPVAYIKSTRGVFLAPDKWDAANSEYTYYVTCMDGSSTVFDATEHKWSDSSEGVELRNNEGKVYRIVYHEGDYLPVINMARLLRFVAYPYCKSLIENHGK